MALHSKIFIKAMHLKFLNLDNKAISSPMYYYFTK